MASIPHQPADTRPPFTDSVRRALSYSFRAAPGWASARVALLALEALLPLAGLVLVKRLIDAVAAWSTSGSTGSSETSSVVSLLLLLASLVLLAGASRAVSGFVSQALGHELTDFVQDLIHDKSLSLDLAYFETPGYHDHLHRAQREGALRPIRILEGSAQLLLGAASLTAIGALLFAYEPALLLVFGLAGTPWLVLRVRQSRALHDWSRASTASERLTRILDALLTQAPFAKELRQLELGALLRGRHRLLRERLREERLARARSLALDELLGSASAALALVACLGFVLLRVHTGLLTLGDLALCLCGAQRGLDHARQVASACGRVYEDGLFFRHLEEFLALTPKLVECHSPVTPPRRLHEGIFVDRLRFRYPTPPAGRWTVSRSACDPVRSSRSSARTAPARRPSSSCYVGCTSHRKDAS